MIQFHKAKSRNVDTRVIDDKEWNALLSETVAGPPHMGSDRRTADRHRRTDVMNLQIGLRWFGKSRERFLVRTRDVSRSGMGFLHSQSMAQGTRCRLQMLTTKNKLMEVDGKVAYCHERGDGVFAVGVEFAKPLTLIDLVAPPGKCELKLSKD